MTKISIIKTRVLLGLILILGAAVFIRTPEELYHYEALSVDYSVKKDTDVIETRNIFLHSEKPETADAYVEQLMDFNYIARNIFLADPRTKLLASDINAEEFLAMDFTVNKTDGPQVLIFHAHSMEMFADSDPADPFTGVLGVGRYLAQVLEEQHGLKVLHHTERFDVVRGIPNRQGAYERLEPVIKQILTDNPSIQVVIDLHRDGVGSHVQPMVSYINGERAAQIMFVNGLSRRYRNGEITPVTYLPNPYQRENLAFSFNLQLAANRMYPGFARRVYLLEFRYSLHMAPKSILLEVGAQNNTFKEALNSIPPFANILASVILN